jgi:molecular chaperone DnaK (HSP70)
MPRGVPQIEISYELDSNGILQVAAVEKSTNKSHQITIKNESNKLSKEDIERMIKEAEQYREQDQLVADKIEAKNSFESFLYQTKNEIEKDSSKVSKEESDTVKTTVSDALQWLETPSLTTQEIKNKRDETEKTLMPIMMKLSGNVPMPNEHASANVSPKVDEVD